MFQAPVIEIDRYTIVHISLPETDGGRLLASRQAFIIHKTISSTRSVAGDPIQIARKVHPKSSRRGIRAELGNGRSWPLILALGSSLRCPDSSADYDYRPVELELSAPSPGTVRNRSWLSRPILLVPDYAIEHRYRKLIIAARGYRQATVSGGFWHPAAVIRRVAGTTGRWLAGRSCLLHSCKIVT